MIGYAVSEKRLKALIKAERSDWLARARERTAAFRAEGRYTEKHSIWSEVKSVYMRLQGDSKCAYCERKLESVEYGRGEQDVEHFRPKKRVRAWKAPKALRDEGIHFSDAPDDDKGYFLLPYHPFNYSAACIPCNRALKRDYFPISGSYNLGGRTSRSLLKEKPYLIYPIGDFDEKPENLISFHGTSPQAVAKRGHRRNRALVTIEFFKLDDVEKRMNLFKERAQVIIAMHPYLEKAQGSATAGQRAEAMKVVRGYARASMQHTSCARSFVRLFRTDPTEAKELYDRARRLFLSKS